MPNFIESNEQLIQDLRTVGFAIGKLDDSAIQELSCAREHLVQEIIRPPYSTPVSGYSTIQHMPPSCLHVQTLPCITDVFRQFYCTRNVVFTYDVPLHVAPQQEQRYRGLGRMNYPVVALIVLNKQKIGLEDTEVDIGNVVFWKVNTVSKYCFTSNKSETDWFGLFTGFWPEMNDRYGVEMRQWLFETGQFGLFHDGVVTDGKRVQEVRASRVHISSDAERMSTLIGTNNNIPFTYANAFYFPNGKLENISTKEILGKKKADPYSQMLYGARENVKKQLFPDSVKKIERRPRVIPTIETKAPTKPPRKKKVLTELTGNKSMTSSGPLQRKTCTSLQPTVKSKSKPTADKALKPPRCRKTTEKKSKGTKNVQFKEEVDVSFFDNMKENEEQPTRTKQPSMEKKKRNRKQKCVKPVEIMGGVSSPPVCPSVDLNPDINDAVPPAKLLKKAEVENQIDLMHTAMIRMIKKTKPEEPSFMDVVTNIGLTNCIEYPKTDAITTIDLTMEDNDEEKPEDIVVLIDSDEAAMDFQEVTPAQNSSPPVQYDVNPQSSYEMDSVSRRQLMEDLDISSDSDDDRDMYMARKPVLNAMQDDQMNRVMEQLHKGYTYSSDEESIAERTPVRHLIDNTRNDAPFRTVNYKKHRGNVYYCKSDIPVQGLSKYVLYLSTPDAVNDFVGKCWNTEDIFRVYFFLGNDVSTKYEIRGENATSPMECLKALHILFCNRRGFFLRTTREKKRPCDSSFSFNREATQLEKDHQYRVDRNPGKAGVCCPICHPVVSIKEKIHRDRKDRFDKLMLTEYCGRVLSIAEDPGKENKGRYQKALTRLSEISRRISTDCKKKETPIHLSVLTSSEILDSHNSTATMIKDAMKKYVDNKRMSERELDMEIQDILLSTEEMQKIHMMKKDKYYRYLYNATEPHDLFLKVLLFKHTEFKDIFSQLQCSIE